MPAVVGEAAAEPDEPEHPAEEARAARPSKDPGAPTQADRDAHAATHLPFRSWCDECVQGRRDAPPHCRQKRGAGEIPEVQFDYAYLRRDDEEDLVTMLVMRDRDTKSLRGWVLARNRAAAPPHADPLALDDPASPRSGVAAPPHHHAPAVLLVVPAHAGAVGLPPPVLHPAPPPSAPRLPPPPPPSPLPPPHPTPHHSPLTTHRSPLTTYRSPLTTRLSPLTTHHSPLLSLFI